MGFICPKCDHHVSGSAFQLVSHIKNAHALIFGHMFTSAFTCGQDGCMRTFRYTYAFKRHIEKNHEVVASDEEGSDDDNEAREFNNENLDEDDNDDDARDDPPVQDEDLWDDLSEEKITDMVAISIARMKASSSIVQSTIDMVVAESSALFLEIVGSLKEKTTKFLSDRGFHEDDAEVRNLLETFEYCKAPYHQFRNSYQQEKYFDCSSFFIRPTEVPIGLGYFPHHNAITGHVEQLAKHITFQYVPMKKLLKCVLESKNFMNTLMQYHCSNDGILRDFHDGKFCQEHYFFSNPNNIQLLLYVDECEVANPLGSKAGLHKIGVVYCTILNIPPKYRSSLCNCFLVAMYNAGDVKTYGYDAILRPLVEDIKDMETNGLYIDTDVYRGIVKASITQVSGDNLGVNGLFGFVESFVGNHFCRQCKMHRNDMRYATTEISDFVRRQRDYDIDVATDDPSTTGIKTTCLLNDVHNFHVTNNFAPDIMHDLLEGVCSLEVHLVLETLIQDGYLTLDLLNSRITSFDYGIPDAKNKPSVISANKLQNPDGPTHQTASQMWCLIRHLPLLIGDKVPEDNEHYELLLLLLDCMDIIFSYEVTEDDTLFLKHVIKDHHEHFLHLYPLRHLKPKHHFMTHYPRQIRMIGPLVRFWTMRFEAKHSFFKRLGHIVCNFRNILKTLSFRQQMYFCYNMIGAKDLVDRDTEVGPGSSTLVASLDNARALGAILHVHLLDEVYVAKWCVVHGKKYQKNMVVVTGKTEELEPIFQRIVYIICMDDSIRLVTEPFKLVRFDRHTHSYIVQSAADEIAWNVTSVEGLLDYQPYHAAKSYDQSEESHLSIVLRHKIH